MKPGALRIGSVGAADVSPETTLGLLLAQAERRGSAPFLHHFDPAAGGWQAVGWDQFRDLVLRVAAGLVAAGVEAGDRVLLLSENSFEWMVCDLGIQACGAAGVAVHSSLTAETVASIVENSQPRLAIVSTSELASKLPRMRIVRTGDEVAAWMSNEELEPPVERMLSLRPDTVAAIAYTSGTTGRPKGALVTHAAIVAMTEASARAMPVGPDDVILAALPLSHILERVSGLYFGGLRVGAQIYVGRGLDHFLEDVQAARPTCMNAVPRLLEKLKRRIEAQVEAQSWPVRPLFRWALAAGSQNPLADRLLLRRIRRRLTGGRLRFFSSGAAPLAVEVERFFWSLGLPVFQGWGLTETSGVAAVNTPSAHRYGTVGRPVSGVRLRIAADGEVFLRSPGLMTGYHRNPEATAEAFDDGWFRTGDLGVLDEDGFLTITDRKKELLKTSGGKFVAPLPIETALQQDPLVEAAIVVGDGRPFATALLVPDWPAVRRELGLPEDPAAAASSPELVSRIQRTVDTVNSRLASFETIKRFRLLPGPLGKDEVTVTYKLRRKVILQHYAGLIEAMYSEPPR